MLLVDSCAYIMKIASDANVVIFEFLILMDALSNLN